MPNVLSLSACLRAQARGLRPMLPDGLTVPGTFIILGDFACSMSIIFVYNQQKFE